MSEISMAMKRAQFQIEKDEKILRSIEDQLSQTNSLIQIFNGRLTGKHKDTSTYVKTFTPDSDYGCTTEVHSVDMSNETMTNLIGDLTKHRIKLSQEIEKIKSKYI